MWLQILLAAQRQAVAPAVCPTPSLASGARSGVVLSSAHRLGRGTVGAPPLEPGRCPGAPPLPCARPGASSCPGPPGRPCPRGLPATTAAAAAAARARLAAPWARHAA
eukprot:2233349-Pyramimonas_sp.AAC.2